MSSDRSRREFATRVGVSRDRNKEAAAERVGRGMPATGRVSEARAPAALGLGPGRALPSPERGYFEHRLGTDLAAVRVHPDASAATELGARGFAAGRDIGIAPGHWRPGTGAFRQLLGHELAHTLQQGQSGPAVQLDGPDPPLKEAKPEEATTAISGGLKTVADQFSKNDQMTDWAKGIGMQIGMPIWNSMGTGDKAAAIGTGALMYGLGVGSMAADPTGRKTLSGLPIGAPLGLIPYSPIHSFSFDAPQGKYDPTLLHFGLKGDDLLELAAEKVSFLPKLTLSFDFTMAVGSDGKVSTPFAMANFGIMPGVNVFGGWGIATDWKTMVQPGPGAPLAPYEYYPKAAQPAPPAGAAIYFSVDLLKAPFIPRSFQVLFGGAPEDQRDKGK